MAAVRVVNTVIVFWVEGHVRRVLPKEAERLFPSHSADVVAPSTE